MTIRYQDYTGRVEYSYGVSFADYMVLFRICEKWPTGGKTGQWCFIEVCE